MTTRPPQLPTGAPPVPAVLAVDVGGTSLKAAVVDASGRPVHRERRTTRTGTRGVADLTRLLGDLAAHAAARGWRPVAAGVVTPGVVDDTTGVVEFAANLRWRSVPLRAELERATGLPVAVAHDARAAGRAEHLLSRSRAETYAFVPIGTGISAAVLTGGTPLAGATRSAGEFGHVAVHDGGEECGCGQRGCLEAYASASAVLRRYLARGGRGATSAADVVAALGRDTDADAVWADAVEALAIGLQGMTMLLDPEEIVLGGGLSRAGTALLGPVTTALEGRLAWRPAPRVSASRLGPAAGRVGAALLGFERAGLADHVHRWSASEVCGPDPDPRRVDVPAPAAVDSDGQVVGR
ncbi:ROK family protein [Kineococcus sp. SYSU DK002]|uniref:ROK family protein n=1 Tax=Kineococcus sp. SYSU DK002 TaxID=3383123 RepID=UPI003D7CDEBF